MRVHNSKNVKGGFRALEPLARDSRVFGVLSAGCVYVCETRICWECVSFFSPIHLDISRHRHSFWEDCCARSPTWQVSEARNAPRRIRAGTLLDERSPSHTTTALNICSIIMLGFSARQPCLQADFRKELRWASRIKKPIQRPTIEPLERARRDASIGARVFKIQIV